MPMLYDLSGIIYIYQFSIPLEESGSRVSLQFPDVILTLRFIFKQPNNEFCSPQVIKLYCGRVSLSTHHSLSPPVESKVSRNLFPIRLDWLIPHWKRDQNWAVVVCVAISVCFYVFTARLNPQATKHRAVFFFFWWQIKMHCHHLDV